MNIFRVLNTILYPLFVYVLFFSGRILVESTDTSATPTAISSGVTTVNPDQDGSATPTAGGSTDSSKKTGVELSLKEKKATPQFEYNKNGNIVTFTAKDTFGFSSVKTKKGGSCGSGGTDFTIWDAKDETEYATKVVLYGKGKKDKIVTIYFPDDTNKSYKKDKNNPWSEYTGPLPSTGHAESSKSSDVSDGSGFELDIKPSTDTSDTDKYDLVNASFGTKIYNIKPNVKINVIKVDGNEVWKHDASKKFGDPKKINYNKEQNKINIILSDAYLVYNKNGEKWEIDEKSSTKPKSTTNSTSGSTGTGGGGTTPATPTGGGTTGTDPSRGSGGRGTQQSTPATH